MNTESDPKKPARRNKLGLALAGGGFRASLFHLGVLRRMAEMDLLRYVEVLSTVSGGSIIGALYILLLKKKIAQTKNLSRADYVEIIEELDVLFVRGVKKNLRTRLLMNPFGLLRVLVTSFTLGKRMSRLYERYLYQSVVNELQPSSSWWSRLWRPGKILLRDVKMQPAARTVPGGIESYNKHAAANGNSVITNLILNATSLNSGMPFRFSSVELGDARLGFFRYDEIPLLLKRRKLLFDTNGKTLQAQLQASLAGAVSIANISYERRIVSLAEWWRRTKAHPKTEQAPEGWELLFDLSGFSQSMVAAEFGLLRDLKLSAWYLRVGATMTPPVSGGLTTKEHLQGFWAGFARICEDVERIKQECGANPAVLDLLLDFMLEFYYLRSAEVMSSNIEKHWNLLTLGEAVGASACFPPVFPPYITHHFYDDAHVSRLGLTDGGVYDNVGLTTLFAEQCNYIIASDTGGLFLKTERSSSGRMGMLGRIYDILQEDIGETQREVLRSRRQIAKRIEELVNAGQAPADALAADDLRGLAFFHIQSPHLEGLGLSLDLDRKQIAMLRTDLDGFGDVEIAALVNHGYDTADRYLRKYLAGSPYENAAYWTPAQNVPKPMHCSSEHVNEILRAGHSRFFRSLQLRAPVSILFTIAALVAAIAALWKTELSLEDVTMWIANASLGWIESLASFLRDGWTKEKLSVGVVLLLCVAIGAILVTLKIKLTDLFARFKNNYLSWSSRLASISKWIKSLSYNAAWVTGLLPLFLILGCSALAWISHLFFYLPFERRTRNVAK